jgi:hypothetical protein
VLVNVDRWVNEDIEPPPSIFPRLRDGTAVEAESLARFYAKVPGTRFPERIVRPPRLDFGPDYERGIAKYPPTAGAPYKTYVSAVDADGNEIAGVRPPELEVPLATFTGWNTRHPETGGAGDLMSMNGSTLRFPLTRSERESSGDPRAAIAERYASKSAYLERVREATRKQIAARHVLAEDLEPVIERAGRLWDWVHTLPRQTV